MAFISKPDFSDERSRERIDLQWPYRKHELPESFLFNVHNFSSFKVFVDILVWKCCLEPKVFEKRRKRKILLCLSLGHKHTWRNHLCLHILPDVHQPSLRKRILRNLALWWIVHDDPKERVLVRELFHCRISILWSGCCKVIWWGHTYSCKLNMVASLRWQFWFDYRNVRWIWSFRMCMLLNAGWNFYNLFELSKYVPQRRNELTTVNS